MKLSKKKSLPVKVYLRKDETMKNGDILLQFDRPFSMSTIKAAQMYYEKYSSNQEMTFAQRMMFKNLAMYALRDEFRMLTQGLYDLEIEYFNFTNKKNPKKSPKIETKQPRLGHIDCPPHIDYCK